MMRTTTEPLIAKGRQSQTSFQMKLALSLVVMLLVGALVRITLKPNNELATPVAESSLQEPNAETSLRESLEASPEAPVGVIEALDNMSAQELVDNAIGGIKTYQGNVGEWKDMFMRSTGSDFCWTATAHNAARLAWPNIFVQNPADDTKGFLRDQRKKGDFQASYKNITPKIATFITRANKDTCGGSGYYMRKGEDGCDPNLWTKNPVLMGTQADPEKFACWGWGSAYKMIQNIGLPVNAGGIILCAGGKCRSDMMKAFDEGAAAIVVGTTYGESYSKQGARQLIHFLALAGYVAPGGEGEEWFFVLDPSGPGNLAYTDDALKPFKMRRLSVMDVDEEVSQQIVIDGTTDLYIINYMIVHKDESVVSKKVTWGLAGAGH